MKKIIYTTFIWAIAGLALTSCEDMFGSFLDKAPSNELTKEQVFSDWQTAMQQHYDTYNFFLNGAGRIDSTWLDAATDLAETSFSKGVKMTFNIGNYYGEAAKKELRDTWESRYRGIRKCNMTLQYIDNVPRDIADSETKYNTDKMNFKGEARFLRVYFYWELFLRFGTVPIVKEVLDPDGDLLTGYTTRPSLSEYVNFLLTELATSETEVMAYSDGVTPANAGRVCKPWPRALASRIKLYMASPRFAAESGITWEDAMTAAKEFMDTYGSPDGKDANGYKLITVSNDATSPYTNAILRNYTSNYESIIFRNDVSRGWGDIDDDSPVGEGGRGGLCPSQNLVDMFDMADGSAPFAEYDDTGAPVYNGNAPAINASSSYTDATMWQNRDPRLKDIVLYQGVKWGYKSVVDDPYADLIDVRLGQRDNPVGNANATPTGYYVCKYIPQSILNADHTGSNYRNWIIMRYAEILLNYAEAYNEVNGPGAVLYEVLDQVRHRGGITGSVADRADLKTKEAMRNFIRKERAIELCYEEQRWWDVRRWNVATKVLSRPIYGIVVSGGQDDPKSYTTINRKVSQQRVFEDKMYLYPIPETEVWKTNLANNPGW